MWLLDNQTPYAAERNWIRDINGTHGWVVAVRGTFEMGRDGRPLLLDEQPPPTLEPEYRGDPGQSSLVRDSDLLEEKHGTDVLVLGSAHAPGGRPVHTVPVLLRVGSLEKQLIVHGHRVYFEGPVGLTTTSARPFVEQPVIYELAFGGGDTTDPDPANHRIDERNPVGRGFPPQAKLWTNQPAHCIEYPSGSVRSRGPAGFGPIDRSWLPRRTLAGTYDAAWANDRRPMLPTDYDPRFALSAPEDQRTSTPLVGGERIGVLNMSPDATMVIEVPRVSLRLSSRIDRKWHEHGARLVTVSIEPGEGRFSVVWQSVLQVASPDVEYLDVTRIVERPS